MIKGFLAAVSLLAFCAAAQAGGADDLKAATDAAQQGQVNDAVRLFTQALAAGDLSPADQLAAHKGRGTGYTSQSLIADAFERLDQARTLREQAIADFTAAIKAKADDADLYVARGQAYDFNGQYDPAIADFTAAFKIKASPLTLAQRAGSKSAKGDYDHAIADYSAALELAAKDPKGAGIEATDLYSERGYTNFAAMHFADAAADLDKGLTLGTPTRRTDVLWLPYQSAWLHIARARAGQDDREELARNAAKMDVKQWPGTLVAYFLGEMKLDDVAPASTHGSMGHARECNLAFFIGEQALAKKDNATATQQLTRARAACNIHTVHYLITGVELKRLGK